MRNLVILLSCLLLLSGCTSTQSNPPTKPSAETHSIAMASMDAWHRGVTAFQKGDTQHALAYYDQAIAKDANNFHAYADKGLLLSLEGDYAQGDAALQKALQIAPENAAVHYNLAMHYKLQGQLEKSLQEFTTVLQKEPKHTWSLYGIATIYADRGDDSKALDYLAQAIATDPQVRDTARTQDHFARFHDNARFRQLVDPQ